MAEGFDIKLLKNGKVIFSSQTDALTQMSELVATDLSPSSTYEVEVSKAQLESFLWNKECRVVSLIATSYQQ